MENTRGSFFFVVKFSWKDRGGRDYRPRVYVRNIMVRQCSFFLQVEGRL